MNIKNIIISLFRYLEIFVFSSIVNCVWGVWNQWGGCSKNCGGGQRSRSRTKIIPQSNGGSCPGSGSENRPCNTQKCESKCCMLGFICGISGKCLFG